MLQKFEKFEEILARIQSVFFCIVLGFMAVVMFAAVIYRYVLNDPIIWSEELITIMQGRIVVPRKAIAGRMLIGCFICLQSLL